MLRGTLDDFTLSDIFRLLSFTKKTGKLEVKRNAGEGNVFFRDGDVYFAQSSLKKEPLGQKLIRSGSLTEAQLLKALDLHASTGQRVGEILLEQGAITQEQLVGAVAEQIEDAAFDLLRWELGEFLFEAHERFEVEIPISVSVENLIMEASRRLDELDVIQRKIPSAEVVLSVAPAPPDGARQINISPEEWRLLVLVDGSRTVGEVCEMAGLDDFAGIRTLYGMISSGLLDIAELGPATSEEVLLTPPSPVDSSMQAAVEVADEPAAAYEDAVLEEEPMVVRAPDEPAAVEVTDERTVAFEDAALEEEPMVVRAPDEVVVNEAYEQIAGLASDLLIADDVLEDVSGVGVETTDAAVEDLDEGPVERPEEATTEVVSSEPVVESYDELLADFQSEIEAGATAADTEDVLAPEYSVADGFASEGSEFASEDEFAPLKDEFVSQDSEFATNAEFASKDSEPVADEYADTPLEEILGPENPVGAPDPDLSEVIASGVPDDWFRDPQPVEDESAPQAPPPPSSPDPFLDDILNGEITPPAAPGPAAPQTPDAPGPRVDRAAVVRELAGLFSDEEAPRRVRPTAEEAEGEDTTPTGAAKRRVEDDDQINKGLIGRFIDGVKGM